jgi:hypothetical protein
MKTKSHYQASSDGLAKLFNKYPNAVVIDGDDDWYAPSIIHPDQTALAAKIKIISDF